MFDKLLNEKNRYLLVNLIFTLIIIIFFLLNIALLKDNALNLLSLIINNVKENIFLVILLIIYTGIFGVYLIARLLSQKIIINGSLMYLSMIILSVHLFNVSEIKEYFEVLNDVTFKDKFIFIVSYIVVVGIILYSLWLIIKKVFQIIKNKMIDYDAPRIYGDELKQAIGLYYLDFDYNKNFRYYVTYESNGKVVKEDLTEKKILCLVGDLLPNEEYEIKLHSLGKFKAKFISLESKECIKFVLNGKPSELQERIAYYYHYSPILIDAYIALLQVFDKMFKRMLIYSPEVLIIESITNKVVFAKIHLDKENIVVRFNANPYLLEGELNIINSFEEDCMYPTKYIVRNLDDVEYMKKIVEKIKNVKR